ncbi:MAG: hypothetical protein AAFU77_18475, partial [Myxococcota bacterium]
LTTANDKATATNDALAAKPPKNAANPRRFCFDFSPCTLRLNSPRSKAGVFPETLPNDAAAAVEED